MTEAQTNRKRMYDKSGPIVAENLKKRNFDAWYVSTREEAVAKALELIPQEDVVSWGGSMTVSELGLKELLEERGNSVIDRNRAKSPEEREELMRRAFFCDTYLMSTNALSMDGQLVNIDGNGNRVAAMIYGPKSVIVIAGMNKVTKTLDAAWERARHFAAPANAQRFDIRTPCLAAGQCADCKSADSVCAYMVTTRISRPPKKIKVILVGEELGL